MLQYLRLAADHPDVLGIALHEYSFTLDIWRDFDNRNFIGRFEKLLAVCDKYGIKRPWIEIKEWGWEETDIPSNDVAIRHIAECAEYYANFPEILMAAIWTARKWHGSEDVHKKVQNLAPDLYDFALNASFPDPEEPEPPNPSVPLNQHLWEFAMGNVRLNFDAALQKAMLADGYVFAGFEEWTKHDGDSYATQAAMNLETSKIDRAYIAKVPEWQNVYYIEHDDAYPPVKPPIEIDDIVSDLPVHETKKYSTRPLNDITHLVVHHTVSPPDRPISSIAAFHVNTRGWPGIGYHFVIDDKGNIYQTNYLETISYHVGGQNHYAVGIALQGNFQNQPPPQAQIDAAAALAKYLRSELVTVEETEPHRGMPGQSTACPGNTWEDWFWQIEGEAPPPNLIDMAPYFSPPNGREKGDVFILSNNWRGGNERVQLPREGDRVFVTKNQQFEQRRISNDKIHLEIDTSPGDGEYYTVDSPTGWMPRLWFIGGRFKRIENTYFYNKAQCQLQRTAYFESDLIFVDHYDSWRGKGDIFFNDVIELAWEVRRQDGSTYIDERYWFAAGYGLVGWLKYDGRESWVSEITSGQQDNVREQIECL